MADKASVNAPPAFKKFGDKCKDVIQEDFEHSNKVDWQVKQKINGVNAKVSLRKKGTKADAELELKHKVQGVSLAFKATPAGRAQVSAEAGLAMAGLKVDGKIGCNLVKQKPSAKAEFEYKMDFVRVNANVDFIKAKVNSATASVGTKEYGIGCNFTPGKNLIVGAALFRPNTVVTARICDRSEMRMSAYHKLSDTLKVASFYKIGPQKEFLTAAMKYEGFQDTTVKASLSTKGESRWSIKHKMSPLVSANLAGVVCLKSFQNSNLAINLKFD